MAMIPEHYYARLAEVESGNNPFAKNPRSSAKGLYQFIDSTGRQYGLHQYQFGTAAYTQAEKRAVRQLTQTNFNGLRGTLGRDPSPGELYLAHQQGLGGARKLLRNPNASAVSTVGSAAVNLNGGNSSMTNQQFANLWIQKFEKGLDPSKVESSFGGQVGDDSAFGGHESDYMANKGSQGSKSQGSAGNQESEAQKELDEELEKAKQEAEEAKAEVERLKAELENEKNNAEQERLQKELEKAEAEERYLAAKAEVARIEAELEKAESDEEKARLEEELDAAEKELEAAAKDFEDKGGVVEDEEDTEDDTDSDEGEYQSRWMKEDEGDEAEPETEHKDEKELVSEVAGDNGLNAIKLIKILIEKAPLSEAKVKKLKILLGTLSNDQDDHDNPYDDSHDVVYGEQHTDYQMPQKQHAHFDHFVVKRVGKLLPGLEDKIDNFIDSNYPDLKQDHYDHMFAKIVEKNYEHIFNQIKMNFEDTYGTMHGGDGSMAHDYRPDMGDVFESTKDHLDHLLHKHGYTKPQGHKGGKAHQHDDMMDVYDAPEADIPVNQQDIV